MDRTAMLKNHRPHSPALPDSSLYFRRLGFLRTYAFRAFAADQEAYFLLVLYFAQGRSLE
jgi:hypothetical protein